MAAAMSFDVCFADIFNIQLLRAQCSNDNVTKTTNRDRLMQVMPSAVYDSSTHCLTVSSPVIMYNAHVTVTDELGETVFDGSLDITKSGIEILLEEQAGYVSYKLEIECGDINLYGFIG